ncbi:hypothetical protein BV22DRAFT_1024101 [Leucogyrophana mollusca]|uniref:Uncharacterized protein n=1 Tax=Leucogyrophana mollusca TaxID=85980 RepID=A0ACB8AYV1_9AGAM|nr:hypothetical protein BV22DRAFT_1024101 [Leucogyrophana mollusca]
MRTSAFRPLSSICVLPNETLELILGDVSRNDLGVILRTSSFFHSIASRVLYRSISELSPLRATQVVKTLSQNDAHALLVRHLELGWADSHVTGNLLRLLNHALKRLKLLHSLALEFSSLYNNADISWIFGGCSVQLKCFTTSFKCDKDLASFLSTQTRMRELSLRSSEFTDEFHLPPTAMPNLSAFRTVLPCPAVTATVVRGRPVENVSISLSPGDTSASLDALLQSSKELKRLTVMSFETGEPKMLIPEVAKRLSGLEALHIMILMAPPTQGTLTDCGSALSSFTNLQYLTFMAPGVPDSAEDERAVAAAWHRACPTLKTIILPKGVVWFRRDDKWASWNDDE